MMRIKTQNNLIVKNRGRSARGFTLVELLISTTIVLILLGVIGTALQHTNQVVSLSVANQDVSTYAAGLASQMRDDFKKMRGDAYLVIKNQTTWSAGQEFFNNDPVKRPYNLDQIMFFASGTFTSQRFTETGVTALKRANQADTARIWYGHLAGNRQTSLGVGVAFQPMYAALSASASEPILPQRWMLGRHAMLLTNKSPSELVTTGTNFPPTSLWQIVSTSSGPNTFESIAYGEWDMLADNGEVNSIAKFMQQAYSGTAPTGYNSSMANALQSTIGFPDSTSGVWQGAATTAAQNRAIAAACTRIYGTRLLSESTTDMRATAQLASNVLAPYCAEFMVEFAGDFITPRNGVIDYEDAPDHGGSPTDVASSDIYWYGSVNPGTHPTRPARRRVPEEATYGINGFVGPMNYFEYELVNPAGDHQPYTAVFGPDRTLTPWPKLVRVTVVLHDEAGRLHARYVTAQQNGQSLPLNKDGQTYQFIFEIP